MQEGMFYLLRAAASGALGSTRSLGSLGSRAKGKTCSISSKEDQVPKGQQWLQGRSEDITNCALHATHCPLPIKQEAD